MKNAYIAIRHFCYEETEVLGVSLDRNSLVDMLVDELGCVPFTDSASRYDAVNYDFVNSLYQQDTVEIEEVRMV